jgi:hypothetical protein
MKIIYLTILALFFGNSLFSQYGYRDGNRIGISGGISQSELLNSNFKSKPGTGYAGGFSVRGNYYNNWSMIYGMQFFINTVSLETQTANGFKKDTDFELSGVQIRLLGSYNIIKNHVSVDFGPVLQVNGKFTTKEENRNNTFEDTNLTAKNLEEIGNINANLYLGFSGGGKVVRLLVFYQYGLTNVFSKLNDNPGFVNLNQDQEFKGNIGTISAQIVFNL